MARSCEPLAEPAAKTPASLASRRQLLYDRFILAGTILLGIVIVVSGAILFMVMVNMIHVNDKAMWFEVNSQILNACFTLTAFVSHPPRIAALADSWVLYKLQSTGQQQQQQSKVYQLSVRVEKRFKGVDLAGMNGYPFPRRKWWWIMGLLHLNCLSQYPITIVMWFWNNSNRPSLVVPICLPVSFLSGAVGSMWLFLIMRRLHKEAVNAAEELVLVN
ncbi:hypothetical protein BC830DRAFT_1085734 [Chytriomyces sp. MP71]|nr:hypothetical protein BC830DRAFT_1085734 [Chytriomyces sp. MP71]